MVGPSDAAAARDPSASTVERLIGIYDADGTVWGEVSYWVGARLGRAHCALCDITHGSVREKSEWQRCRDGLGVPFEAIHRDDRDEELRALTDGKLACVVAATGDGPRILVGAAELEACAGDPGRLATRITAALDEQGLTLPVPPVDA